MKRQHLLLINFLLFPLLLTAQNKWAGIGIESNIGVGKILRHSPKFPTQLPDRVTSFELNYVHQTSGTKDWQQRRNYPQVGFGMLYTDYGIDSIYGKCIGIYPNVQLPIVYYKDLELAFRAGFGLAYISQRYTRYPDFDTTNTAIGSHMNNLSLFSLDLRYRINKHIDVQAGGYFSHVSNASLRSPNLGINSYGARLGVRYFPVTSEPEKIVNELSPLSNRWLVNARLSLAMKEIAAPDGPMHPIYIVTAFASKRYWSKNKLILGVDYSYHSNIYAFLRNNEIEVGREKANSWRSALIVGNEFMMGRFGILFQLGFYVKQTYLPEDFFYQKLGCNIYLIQNESGILKELSTFIYLKTHKFEAELTEVGFAIGF